MPGIYERPQKKSKSAKVENEYEEVVGGDPSDGGPEKNFFFSDYNQMHAESFATAPQKGSAKTGIQGPKGCTLESLVSTLATLQFTTKGKVGEDGKFEIVFCSPEPVVQEVKYAPSSVKKKVRVSEPLPSEHHRRKRHSRLLWNH